jgi:hypothetical protein
MIVAWTTNFVEIIDLPFQHLSESDLIYLTAIAYCACRLEEGWATTTLLSSFSASVIPRVVLTCDAHCFRFFTWAWEKGAYHQDHE